MKIRPRHHAPTGRNWVSLGLTVREARALTECLRRAMLADRGDPDGVDAFAHSALHQLEEALENVQTGPVPSR